MSFWRTLADLFLPRHCVVCNAELDGSEKDLCNVCLCNLTPVRWNSATNNPLLRSLWDKYDIEAAGSSFYYNTDSDFHNVFMALKYYGCPYLGERLARISFPYWSGLGLGNGVDYIVPIPLSLRRRLKRGYNQAEWVARGVAASLAIPVRNDILVRRKNNDSQTHKTAKERQQNTQGIFSVRSGCENLNSKTILLVDDIVTTGSTLCDCIRALRQVFPDVKVQVFTLGVTARGNG